MCVIVIVVFLHIVAMVINTKKYLVLAILSKFLEFKQCQRQ